MIEGDLALEQPSVMDASTVMALLRRDHRRLCAVLERVESEVAAQADVDALCADERRQGRVLAMLGFLHEYAERIHHPVENRLFDRLIEKGLTPSERRVVFVTMSQHEEILGDLLGLQEALRRLHEEPAGAEGSTPATALRTRANCHLEAHKRHLQFEESQLLPLIESRLTARDWRDVEEELSAQIGAITQVCEAEFLPVFRAILEAA